MHCFETLTWLFGPDSTGFWSFLQVLGVVGGLTLVYQQLRAQAVGNMMQSLHSMAAVWDSDHMMAFRRAASENRLRSDLDVGGVDGEALAFFEDLGLYVRKRVFTLDIVWERYSYYIEHYWCMYETQISKYRESTGDATWFSNFESLYRLSADYSRKLKVNPNKSPAEIERFAASEIRTAETHRGVAQNLLASQSSTSPVLAESPREAQVNAV